MTLTSITFTHTQQAAMLVRAFWARVCVTVSAMSGLGLSSVDCFKFGVVAFASYFRASTTITMKWLAGINVSVFRRKFMSVDAMSFSGMFSRITFSAQNVSSGGYVFQVAGVHARRKTAKMIGMVSIRNDVVKHSERNTMSTLSPALKLKGAVSQVVYAGDPNPTRRSVKSYCWIDSDFAEKAREKFLIYRNAVRIFGNHSSLRNRFDGLGFRGLTHREALSF